MVRNEKLVIRHTVVEQRLYGSPVGCPDFPFGIERCLHDSPLI